MITLGLTAGYCVVAHGCALYFLGNYFFTFIFSSYLCKHKFKFNYMALIKKLFSKDEKIPKDFWSIHDKNDTPMTWVFWKAFISVKVRWYILDLAMALYFLIKFVMNFISGDFEMIYLVLFFLCILLFLVQVRNEKIFYYLYRKEYNLNHYYDNV